MIAVFVALLVAVLVLCFLSVMIVDILLEGLGTIDNIVGDSGPISPVPVVTGVATDFFLTIFFFFTTLSFLSPVFIEALLLLSDNALILTSSVVASLRGEGLDLDLGEGAMSPDFRGGVLDGVDRDLSSSTDCVCPDSCDAKGTAFIAAVE